MLKLINEYLGERACVCVCVREREHEGQGSLPEAGTRKTDKNRLLGEERTGWWEGEAGRDHVITSRGDACSQGTECLTQI